MGIMISGYLSPENKEDKQFNYITNWIDIYISLIVLLLHNVGSLISVVQISLSQRSLDIEAIHRPA
ncbi:hypothetical protein BO94DRAFT_281161 [Aspergillus sclerotioniger CBS 115572]|uniref:Uncharacterized protein n=1 Tax=Aspergillus sclerotioniger CBS 115572 TaxID=1450535 RepID=A0A317XAL3_9EURO|nr:hypothetical protein BO94DRAFT_281161 [Aspergillus sclerotioniger CBS 115572]PWY94672.1 hypothetical protein BO94DRAFT_281161 [Aspergillus sclerotioniger CBS 115572]